MSALSARPRGRAAALAAAGGLLHTASFAPLDAWPLQIAGLALLVVALDGASAKRAAGLGWLFGFAWLAGGMWWLYISLHDFGGLIAPLAAAAVALLAGLLALYYALAAALWARLRSASAAFNAALFAACWLLAELARGVVFTGFPWIAGGYAHTQGPLAAWAPWIGVYGIGALAAWLAAAAALAWRERVRPARAAMLLALPIALTAAGLALPNDFTRGTGTLSVTLLQSNVAQDLKFEAAQFERALRWHRSALHSARGSLVLTPESSIPLPLPRLDGEMLAALRAPFAQGERVALVGLFTGSDAAGYTNSLLALSAASDPSGNTYYAYGKRHLLPFGELIPPGFGWFVRALNIPIGDQQRGHGTALLAVAGQRVRPLICFEDLFGEDIAASVVGDGGATVLANSTNLAWFGARMVQDQHLQFSRMRALELQRPIVRATNTGATAVVDHRGRITARLPPLVQGALEASVEGRIGATPYARWVAAWGLAPLALLALALIGAAVVARRRGNAS
ncbi:MAG: apolipoprotein N-acyltransferase [Burkholderiaceae bacterium]|nr:apolipoprotein N-acyltransferase [Burkholderiaceae bacterium]